ncbi:MAG: hypothetical protein HC836_35570 [Richelia sp. RM2_1_2]|nr:hypothetical protein [Richelia sp. RM2_1_2]
MWSIDIKYNNHNDAVAFIDVFLPAIVSWLEENCINYAIESIMQFEFIDLSPADYYSEAHGVEVQVGSRFTFSELADAIHFKFRWTVIELDTTDEFVKKYFRNLRKGFNQSVFYYNGKY